MTPSEAIDLIIFDVTSWCRIAEGYRPLRGCPSGQETVSNLVVCILSPSAQFPISASKRHWSIQPLYHGEVDRTSGDSLADFLGCINRCRELQQQQQQQSQRTTCALWSSIVVGHRLFNVGGRRRVGWPSSSGFVLALDPARRRFGSSCLEQG